MSQWLLFVSVGPVCPWWAIWYIQHRRLRDISSNLRSSQNSGWDGVCIRYHIILQGQWWRARVKGQWSFLTLRLQYRSKLVRQTAYGLIWWLSLVFCLFICHASLFSDFHCFVCFVIWTKYLQFLLNHVGKSPLFCYCKENGSKKNYIR